MKLFQTIKANTLFLTFALSLFVFPTEAWAQGLVPVQCSSPSTCGTCEFVELINNVLQFLITFASIAATLLIIYGGFKLVTSGGNVSAKESAKSIITNVLIGYVLILTAFLIVNTILGVLLPGNSPILGWQRIECLYPTEPRNRGYREYSVEAGQSVIAANPNSPGSTQDLSQFFNEGVCEQAFLEGYFGSQASVAACVAQGESTCGGSLVSVTDKMRATDEAFSFGAFQINLTVHEVIGCNGIGANSDYLDCKSAFNGRNYSATVANRDLYNRCALALMDKECSAKNAARLQQRDGWGIWSAYTANNCN